MKALMLSVCEDGFKCGEIETLEDWSALGRTIIARAESATWDLADWAAMAVKFGKKPKNGDEESDWHTLKDFCEAHGMNYGSTRVYAYVARAIPMLNRFNKLSFKHHLEVAALSDTEQQKWLSNAESENLSCAELRRRIRDSLGTESAILEDAKEVYREMTQPLMEFWEGVQRKDSSFWTVGTKAHYKKALKPIVEWYHQTL